MADLARIPGIDELRKEIDDVDGKILELLNRRAGLSISIGELKARTPGAGFFDPGREAQLLESLAARNRGPLTNSHVAAIWREIISSSRVLQKPCTVAYLGPEGTFSYFAAVEFLGESMTFVPCQSFAEIFRKVSSGECNMGAVPLENSIHGTVSQNFDLFARHRTGIQAEFYFRVANSLLSREKDLSSIDVVYSHAQPLGQCASWLGSHLPGARLIAVESTAAAALKAASEPRTASIGHRNTCEKLGLTPLADNIEDESDNWTRFVLITAGGMASPHRPAGNGGDFKSSVIFTLSDKVGALSAILGLFAAHHVNMAKLESRPLRGECWKYIFFVDVECDMSSPEYAPLLAEMEGLCTMVRVLGCYPEGPRLDPTANAAGY